MKMINNYLDSFENYLTVDNHKEIREELEASLLDQIEEQEEQLSRPLNKQEQEEFLLKLGHPMKVAAGFLPNQQLVSAEYFPAYKKVLIIALWIYGIITVLRILPLGLGVLDGSFITLPIVIFSSLVETSIWVFAWVTLAFYLFQRYSVNIDFLYAWSPKQLSGSGRKLPLSRVETAFEILFVALFLTWWNSLFSAHSVFFQTELVNQLTMSEGMHTLLWTVNFLGALSIAISLYGFIKAGWNRNSLILNILLGLANLVVIFIMLQLDQYATLESLQEYGLVVTRFVEHMDLNVRITLGVIAAFVIWDIYASFRKLKM
ncbi:MAG: putative membrane protein [Arenicella sp.]|jgi:uncharacterized membrane protein